MKGKAVVVGGSSGIGLAMATATSAALSQVSEERSGVAAAAQALRWAGVAYLVYLAAVIAMAEPPSADKDDRGGRGPMTFWGAALFQWVNVKGWVMVIGTITAYAAIASFPWNIVIQVLLCLPIGVFSGLILAGGLVGVVGLNLLFKSGFGVSLPAGQALQNGANTLYSKARPGAGPATRTSRARRRAPARSPRRSRSRSSRPPTARCPRRRGCRR